MGDLSEHFSLKEFDHDIMGGKLPPESMRDNIRDTLEFLERLRFFMNWVIMDRKKLSYYPNFGISITPNGGYRYDPKVVSGEITVDDQKSRHYFFFAADVRPTGLYQYGFTYQEFYEMALLIDKSFTDRKYRIGKYLGYGQYAWVHIDCAYGYGGLRWTHHNKK